MLDPARGGITWASFASLRLRVKSLVGQMECSRKVAKKTIGIRTLLKRVRACALAKGLLRFDFVIDMTDERAACPVRLFDRMLRKTFVMNRTTTRFTF